MSSAPTIPNSNAPNWIIVPAGRCVSSVAESVRIAGLLRRSVIALASLRPLLAVARGVLAANGKGTADIDQLLQDQQSLGPWAKDLLQTDLRELHTSATIALWTSLEVAVEDTAVLILLRDPTAVPLIQSLGVRLPANLSSPLTEADARRLFVRFERLASGTRSVSETYGHVLESLGLTLSVDAATHAKLSELNYVRSCILHRGGVVDERVAVEAPALGLQVGATVPLGESQYLAYLDAAKIYTLALLDAAVKSRHTRVLPGAA